MESLGFDEIYIDRMSGKTMDRPELNKSDTVVVESIRHFARNTRDLLELVEQLTAKGVEFMSQKEVIDTSTATGKFMLTVFGAVAELEREYILQRQREGIAIAKGTGEIHRTETDPASRVCTGCQPVEKRGYDSSGGAENARNEQQHLLPSGKRHFLTHKRTDTAEHMRLSPFFRKLLSKPPFLWYTGQKADGEGDVHTPGNPDSAPVIQELDSADDGYNNGPASDLERIK